MTVYKELSDDELRAKTDEFRTRLENGETLFRTVPIVVDNTLEVLKELLLNIREFPRRYVQRIVAPTLQFIDIRGIKWV